MRKRNGSTGDSMPVPPAAAAAAASAAALPSAEEKTPEEKAAIAAVVQAPPGAAEPFAAVAPADVAKNIVVSEAAAAVADASHHVQGEEPATLDAAAPVPGATTDIADALGGPIPRAPAIAAAVEHFAEFDAAADRSLPAPGLRGEEQASRLDTYAPIAQVSDRSVVRSDFRQDLAFDPLGDLAGRILMVRSASDRGRRRAGYGFGPVATAVDVDDLTAEQLGALLSDKQLFAELLPRED